MRSRHWNGSYISGAAYVHDSGSSVAEVSLKRVRRRPMRMLRLVVLRAAGTVQLLHRQIIQVE